MNRRQKIIVSVTGIFIVLLILIGLTYAYFLTRITGNSNPTSISVTTANLELVYGDGTTAILTSSNPLMPSSTPIGTKDFTVTNNGDDSEYVVVFEDVTVKYAADTVIDGEAVTAGTDTTFESNDFVYTLTCEVKDKSGNTLSNKSCDGVENETFPMDGGIVVGNSIDKDDVHNYVLTLYYLDNGLDQSADMNKALNGKVNIKDIKSINPYSENTSSLAYNIINNSMLNKNGTELLSKPLTTPAKESSGVTSYKTTGEEATVAYAMSSVSSYASKTWFYYDTYEVNATTGNFTLSGKHSCTYNSTTTNANGETVNCYDDMVNKYLYSHDANHNSNANLHTFEPLINTNVYKVTSATATTLNYVKVFNSPNEAERVLAPTTDDYGTSYYFRGNVSDNYVTFAGMCWRIVRIDGNGNTKLILEDQDEVCSTTMNGNWDIEASDGTNITLNGTEPYRTGNFGYDDSTGKYKMSYLNPVDNPNRAMVNAFKYFQTNTLTNKISSTYENKSLSDFLVSGNWCLNNKAYSDRAGTTLLENPTYTSNFYYDSYVRLYGKTIKEPTLKCPVETMETFGDNTTPMYVGGITADEIVYAGGKAFEKNPNYYLINNYQKSNSKHFWSLSPSIFEGGYVNAFVVADNSDLTYDCYVNSNYDAFRPSVSLVSSAVISSGEGTLEKPYVIG